jgi:lysozyme family protein
VTWNKKGTLEPSWDEQSHSSLDLSSHRKLFDTMIIRKEWIARVSTATDQVVKNRSRYESLSKRCGVPWYMIGCIHILESGGSFSRHLHNGDPLSARTKQVPRGRPKTGTPPFSWEESALDALAYDNIAAPLNTIGEQFEKLERFNGIGYRKKGINTPYLWSGSTHYTSGKYVADNVWSSTAVSQQVGAACIYKLLLDREIIKI